MTRQPMKTPHNGDVPLPLDNSGAPPSVPVGETESQDQRALSLGNDSAGGYAVPFQLDGSRKPKPAKRKPKQKG